MGPWGPWRSILAFQMRNGLQGICPLSDVTQVERDQGLELRPVLGGALLGDGAG